MKENNIRILVACHKPCDVPEDPIYMPIHVGCEGKEPIGFTGDNTGENISSRNPEFCELTGLYWAWKNLKCDYIGLVQYRRYFTLHRKIKKSGKNTLDKVLTGKQTTRLLKKYRVLVPMKRRYYIESLYSHYDHTHDGHHLDVTREILERKCPEFIGDFDEVITKNEGYMFNMFISDKDFSDRYCEWLFDILFELVDTVGTDNMTGFERRYAGRISEILFNVYLAHMESSGELKKEEVRELPYLYLGKMDWGRKVRSFLAAKFLNKKYESSF